MVLALVSSVESTLNNGGKFILRPYLDIPELASAVSEIEPGRFRASVLHRVSEGHTVTLDYDVKHAEKTHSIHFDMDGLEEIVCGRDTVLVLRFVDEVYANKVLAGVPGGEGACVCASFFFLPFFFFPFFPLFL